jgi:hypothetical protein
MIERPAREGRSAKFADGISALQKNLHPDKTENEGIQESRPALAEQAGLILLLTEKLAPLRGSHDEHNQTDILTSGVTSLPPSRRRSFRAGQWLVGVCSPLQWRNRPRFSRGSLTPGCHRDEQIVHQVSKNKLLLRSRCNGCKLNVAVEFRNPNTEARNKSEIRRSKWL